MKERTQKLQMRLLFQIISYSTNIFIWSCKFEKNCISFKSLRKIFKVHIVEIDSRWIKKEIRLKCRQNGILHGIPVIMYFFECGLSTKFYIHCAYCDCVLNWTRCQLKKELPKSAIFYFHNFIIKQLLNDLS